MNNKILTVDELVKLVSKQILVKASICAGPIFYKTEKDIPKVVRIDDLPSGYSSVTDINIIGRLENSESPTAILGKLSYRVIGGDWANVTFYALRYRLHNDAERKVVHEELITHYGLDKLQLISAIWWFLPVVEEGSKKIKPEDNIIHVEKTTTETPEHAIRLDPHDPRLMVHYTYILGRLTEFIKRTELHLWLTMENQLAGFIRAGLSKLRP